MKYIFKLYPEVNNNWHSFSSQERNIRCLKQSNTTINAFASLMNSHWHRYVAKRPSLLYVSNLSITPKLNHLKHQTFVISQFLWVRNPMWLGNVPLARSVMGLVSICRWPHLSEGWTEWRLASELTLLLFLLSEPFFLPCKRMHL